MMLYQLERFKCPGLNIKNIHIWHFYEVENHMKLPYTLGGQKLNAVAIPVKDSLSQEAISYWESLSADRHAEYAFRPENRPLVEEYFTSAENRIRFERILILHVLCGYFQIPLVAKLEKCQYQYLVAQYALC